jgi:hypothetical protein
MSYLSWHLGKPVGLLRGGPVGLYTRTRRYYELSTCIKEKDSKINLEKTRPESLPACLHSEKEKAQTIPMQNQ